MANWIELQAFYKNFNQELESIQQEAGHFNIFKVEDLLLPTSKPVTYSRRNFYKISLVSGHSKIHYADHSIETEDSVLVFTNPMIPFLWERIDEKHSGYVCVFTEAFFSRFGNIKTYPVFANAHHGVIPLAADDLHVYQELFSRMFNELAGDYTYKYDLLRALLMEMVHKAQKMQPSLTVLPSGSNASERITALFLELLERQFPIELSSQVVQLHTPSAFADALNLHVNHLNKTLKEATGQTTSKLISDRLIEEARSLLKGTDWSISEIAWALRFEEPNHFSTFFKNRTGVTPKKFRQSVID